MKNNSIIEQIKASVTKELLAKKGERSTRQRTESLDKNIHFRNGEIYYKNTKCGTYDEDNRKIIIDQQKCINEKGLNPLTSHPSLPTNTTIEIQNGKNKHIVKTDEKGRKVSITNIFKEKIIDSSYGNRNNDEQTKAKLYGDEDGFVDTPTKQKDQGGHATAATSGGLKEMINIFPQSYKVNNSKEWREIENAQREEYKKKEVNFRTTQTFKYDVDSNRPKYITNEIKSISNNIYKEFNNLNSESESDSPPPSPKKIKPNKKTNSKPKGNRKTPKLSILNPFSTLVKAGPILGKVGLVALVIIILILLFLWIKNIFPFNENNKQNNINQNETEVKRVNIDSVDVYNTKKIDFSDALNFAPPLDDLTKSITKFSEFSNIISSKNTIPVIGSIFEYNSIKLSENGKKILRGFSENYMRVNIKNYILVEGFTCKIGSQEYNLKLSKKRAETLKLELINLGVPEKVIKIKPVGKNNFVSSINLKTDLILNRRSNVTIIKSE